MNNNLPKAYTKYRKDSDLLKFYAELIITDSYTSGIKSKGKYRII